MLSMINWAVPVGVPVPAEVIIALKVAGCPNTDGFGADTTAVVVLA
jgi:hypothetical protein